MATSACDAIVLGGGIVGAATAFGLARVGARVVVFDEGDLAFRATRGNFGIVAVQGKGLGRPEYAAWTRRSADAWPKFAAELSEHTGVDIGFERRGELRLCLSEDELHDRARLMADLRAQSGNAGYDYRMLDRREVANLIAGIGPVVTGGSYTPYECEVTPLATLRALHGALIRLGSRYVPRARVGTIAAVSGTFTVAGGGVTATAPRLVVAAGLGSTPLARQVGLEMPLRPERGQIIVTERAERSLPLPLGLIRQTREGGFMLGRAADDVGFDDRTSTRGLASIARTAVNILPYLARVRVVRAWGALRVMSPDALPIYDASRSCPGAFAVTCHSGVTLAAAHALLLAPALLEGRIPDELASFTAKRFAGRTGAWVTSKAP